MFCRCKHAPKIFLGKRLAASLESNGREIKLFAEGDSIIVDKSTITEFIVDELNVHLICIP